MNNLTALLVTLASGAALASAAAPVATKAAPVASALLAKTSAPFKGVEVNGGTVSIGQKAGRTTLRLSGDFKIPKSPAPHWQVVDGQGNVFLLKQLTIVGGKTQREIVLPKYVKSVAKVQIWCSFAEVLLGETTFGGTVKLG